MNKLSRRKLISTALAATAGTSALVVADKLAQRHGLIPPDSGGLYGPGETLTYAAQRLLTRHSLAREFKVSQISKTPFANTVDQLGADFKKLEANGFAGWRLTVDGLINSPGSFSLSELKSLPIQNQITHLACEEGWSYIAHWMGLPLHHILHLVGTQPHARYVVYKSIQSDWWDSLDMADALHPQTLIAYGMNGVDMPVKFGGPLRLRVPRQLAYKSVKYLNHITVTDNLQQFGKGLGSSAPEAGYAWYAGI